MTDYIEYFGVLHLGEEFLDKDGKYPPGAYVQGLANKTEQDWAWAKNNLCEEINVDPSQCDMVFKHTLKDGTEVRKLVRIDKPVTRVR